VRYLGAKTFDRTKAWRHMAMIMGIGIFGYGIGGEEKQLGVCRASGFLNPDAARFEIGWTLGRKFWEGLRH